MFDFSFYQDMNFWIVALATIFLGVALSLLGTVQVMKGQSLLGDAVGHATLPGVVFVFLLFRQRDSFLFFLGAFLSALFAYFCIVYFSQKTKLKPDAVMAIVLSSFFGLGLALKTFAQKIPGAAQARLQSYLFGQAAFLREKEILPLFVVAVLVVFFFILFYRNIKLFLFDADYGSLLGFSSKKMHFLTTLLSLVLIAMSVKAVGGVLMTSLLLAPMIAARQWVKTFTPMLFLSILFASSSAFLGTLLSYYHKGFSTGASIVLFLSFWAFLSLFFSPRGILYLLWKRHGLKKDKKKLCS